MVPDPLGYWISMQETPAACFYGWVINIIAKMAPWGAIGDNIYVVNTACFTINIL